MTGQEGQVELSTTLWTAIAAHAEAAYPREACGLLVGQATSAGWRVTAWHPAENLHPEPLRHFELDPAAHISLLRHLRQTEGTPGAPCLLGHLHSHPDTPAIPSPRDLAMAHDPTMLWLIQSVHQGRVAELTAWRVLPGPCFAPVPLVHGK